MFFSDSALRLSLLFVHIFRKIPWINIYAEVNQEKEQEMIGSVGQGDSTPKITLSEFSTSKELMEKELDSRVKSTYCMCAHPVSSMKEILVPDQREKERGFGSLCQR